MGAGNNFGALKDNIAATLLQQDGGRARLNCIPVNVTDHQIVCKPQSSPDPAQRTKYDLLVEAGRGMHMQRSSLNPAVVYTMVSCEEYCPSPGVCGPSGECVCGTTSNQTNYVNYTSSSTTSDGVPITLCECGLNPQYAPDSNFRCLYGVLDNTTCQCQCTQQWGPSLDSRPS